MEPQLPRPQVSHEQAPVDVHNQGGEAFSMPNQREVQGGVEQGRETRESIHDGPQGDPGAVRPLAVPPPMPVVGPLAPTGNSAASDDSSSPATASDEDLIEKEWVEKAKKLVAETHNDPHAQDAAIGRLQADYLKKRYGKVVALPKEG